MRYNGGQGSNAKDREREDSTPFDEVNLKKKLSTLGLELIHMGE